MPPRSKLPKLPEITYKPSGGGTPGPGGFAPPGGGLPGGKGPQASDVKQTGETAKNTAVADMLRDTIEKAVLAAPADPGHWYESQAKTLLAQAAFNKGMFDAEIEKAKKLDSEFAARNEEVRFTANVAFQKIASYNNLLLSAQFNEKVPTSTAAFKLKQYPQYDVYVIKTASGTYTFTQVWKQAAEGQFPGENTAIVAKLPPADVLKNFPLALNNKDTKEDGQVIPSIVRCLHEQPTYFYDFVGKAILDLVQQRRFPQVKQSGFWPNSTVPKYNYESYQEGGGSTGYGIVETEYQGNLSADTLKKFNTLFYLAGPAGAFDVEISNFVENLIRWRVALQNKSNFLPNEQYKILAQQAEAKANEYLQKADQARKTDPDEAIKTKLISDYNKAIAAGATDLVPINAALKYVDLCVAIRALYDNEASQQKELDMAGGDIPAMNFFADIEKYLNDAQKVADKIAGETNNDNKLALYNQLWVHLKQAEDVGLLKLVAEVKKDNQEAQDAAAKWQPDPQVQQYLQSPLAQDLTDAGFTGLGSLATKKLKELSLPPKSEYDNEAMAKALKAEAKYKELLKMLPDGWAPSTNKENKIPKASEGNQFTNDPPPPPAGLQLSVSALKVEKNKTNQIFATITDSAGKVSPATGVVWQSSDASVARISDSGIVTGITPGSCVVTAQVGDAVASVSVTVTAATPSVNWLLIGGAAAAAFLLVSVLGGKSKE